MGSKSTKARLTRCFAKYEEGIAKLPNESKECLWTYYLDFLMELRSDDFNVATVFRAESLTAAYEKAANEGCLPEKYYTKWMEMVDDKKALVVLREGRVNVLKD